ncbi:DUF7573 domain-containing protein [Halobaculum limi]|uniref:DUF7573 domain-containing protein n=1 Tax=Halobaculum limi TaxID=3031916 RepID=UPI0024075777|nr:hypothetical protein [Halobaculum sp. YSMS11]
MCRRVRRRSGGALVGVNPAAALAADVPEDRSLDDADSDTDADTAADATAPADGDDTVDGPQVSPADVDPVEATLDHTPEGAPCAVCGETVTRRWRDDAGYVCPGCKEW